jgi:putative ABC transport system permease protein
MSYQVPPWMSLVAFLALLAIIAVLAFVLLMAGKVPLRYNLRNLIVRWKTTVSTALAFTVVVVLLMVMHAFAMGIQSLSQGSGQPGNVIVLSDGASDELYSSLPVNETGDVARQEGVLRDSSGRPLCSREVYVLISQPLEGPQGDRQRNRLLQIRGVEEPDISALVHGVELASGTWFSEAGVQESPARRQESTSDSSPYANVEVVLGEGLARELGKERGKESLGLGDVFPMGPRQGVVVGIMRGAATTFGSEVWAKRQKIGEIFGKENLYTSIVVRTDSPDRAKKLAEWLSHDYKKSAVSAIWEPDYFAKMSEANQQFLGAIYFVAGIMALGSVFGVMTTMFAAIRQRSTDIGMLRVLGFARWRILVSFLMESLVIAAMGGLLGCVFGYLVDGVHATSVVGTSGGGARRVAFQMVVDSNTLAAAVVFTLLMGLFGGMLPAISAMRLKPLESLR